MQGVLTSPGSWHLVGAWHSHDMVSSLPILFFLFISGIFTASSSPSIFWILLHSAGTRLIVLLHSVSSNTSIRATNISLWHSMIGCAEVWLCFIALTWLTWLAPHWLSYWLCYWAIALLSLYKLTHDTALTGMIPSSIPTGMHAKLTWLMLSICTYRYIWYDSLNTDWHYTHTDRYVCITDTTGTRLTLSIYTDRYIWYNRHDTAWLTTSHIPTGTCDAHGCRHLQAPLHQASSWVGWVSPSLQISIQLGLTEPLHRWSISLGHQHISSLQPPPEPREPPVDLATLRHVPLLLAQLCLSWLWFLGPFYTVLQPIMCQYFPALWLICLFSPASAKHPPLCTV